MTRNSGLTLVELLLSISISAIIGLLAFALVQVTLATDRNIAIVTQETNAMARAFNRMSEDFLQLAPTRIIRTAFGDYEGYLHSDFESLKLVRNGWAISSFSQYERSSLQRVSYQMAQRGSELCPIDQDFDTSTNCLIRSYTNHIDDDGTFVWRHQMLSDQIIRLEWRFLVVNTLTGRSEFVNQLPRFDQQTKQLDDAVTAIEVVLGIANGTEYSRLFNIPRVPNVVDNGATNAQ